MKYREITICAVPSWLCALLDIILRRNLIRFLLMRVCDWYFPSKLIVRRAFRFQKLKDECEISPLAETGELGMRQVGIFPFGNSRRIGVGRPIDE